MNFKKSETNHFIVDFFKSQTLKAPYGLNEIIKMIDGLSIDEFITVFIGIGEFKPEKIKEGIAKGYYVTELEITNDGKVKRKLKVTMDGLYHVCYLMNENIGTLQYAAETNDQEPFILN